MMAGQIRIWNAGRNELNDASSCASALAMPEIFRTRDVVVFKKGVTCTVSTDIIMRQAGWPGAQGVMWEDSLHDEFLVTFTDGVRGAGFALWGSEEDSDKWTAITGQQVGQGYVVVGSGSWVFSTRVFEQYTYASRVAGPLVAHTYAPGNKLLWSLRGYFTKEDEWAASGDPRAPNSFFVGQVVQSPSIVTSGFMTIQTTL